MSCVIGASCSEPPPAPSCSDHKSCAECSSSSWGCHWCASDEACHAVGSLHGCAAGADCYAIHRCQRLEPEPMEGTGGTFSKESFEGVGIVSKSVLGVLMGLILCCSTLCFAGVTLLKAAVDDLVGEPDDIAKEWHEQFGRVDKNAVEEVVGEELEIPLLTNGSLEELDAEQGRGKSRSGLVPDDEASHSRRRVPIPTLRSSPQRDSNLQRMYCGCQLCYLFTIITTIILFVVGMSYAPREPQYNVCTNELAWKSIVEGMASLKMSASFDLLISVYNPNRFEVDLSNGHGQFHHDDQYVGSFDIPEGRITEKAISDIVVKVTFTPDKWAALSLTSEYYQGNLKFVLNGHAHVTIPALGNYQFDAKFDDIHVNVNDPSLDDTHLCACPGWKKPIRI
ncbi:hypothetical protein ACHAWU_005431 [Discostella pseudostelligera]|uniref:Late embryogenesis abundant protein LEA-2 subgroup domain-containing protein n=1 Tax=Discostella pseudostelligera TaxID=259834 RepID=A0ABD3MVK1_9STRA